MLSVMTQHMCAHVQVGKDEGKAVVHEFSHEAMREAGVSAGVPPFAVISSNTNDLSVGRCVRVCDGVSVLACQCLRLGACASLIRL